MYTDGLARRIPYVDTRPGAITDFYFRIFFFFSRSTKDHLRMRMEETGWTNMLTKMITTSITKRVESGQDVRSIKFDQLYTDIIEHARGKDWAAR